MCSNGSSRSVNDVWGNFFFIYISFSSLNLFQKWKVYAIKLYETRFSDMYNYRWNKHKKTSLLIRKYFLTRIRLLVDR